MSRFFASMYLSARFGAACFGAAACGASDASSFADASGGPTATGGGGSTGAGGAGAGGAAVNAGGTGAAGGAGMAAQLAPFAATGSLDLLVTKVDVSQAMGPAAKNAPSMGAQLRIDLPDFKASGSKGQATAIVTPRWGEPAVFNATLGTSSIELSGSTTIHGPGASDVWQTISIPLAGGTGGKATGAVTVTGQESVFSSGVGYSGKIIATGVLAPDSTAPQGKPVASGSFADGQLPWEPLRVTFAEPIAKLDAAAHLAVIDDAGAPAPFAFVLTPDVTSGAVTGLAYASSWDGLGTTLTLRLASGYVDGAQNVGQGFEQSASFFAVAKAIGAAQKFDGAGAPASWGVVSKVVDPTCESIGCVVIGPFANAHCGVPASGFAVRLTAPASPYAKVRVRYRVFYAGGGAPNATVVPLSIQLARPGGAPIAHDLAKPPAPQELGMPADFSFATPWTTIELAIPTGASVADEIGIAIRGGGEGSSAPCATDTPPEAPALTKVVIDSVSAM